MTPTGRLALAIPLPSVAEMETAVDPGAIGATAKVAVGAADVTVAVAGLTAAIRVPVAGIVAVIVPLAPVHELKMVLAVSNLTVKLPGVGMTSVNPPGVTVSR